MILFAILLILCSSFFAALGAVFLKKGSAKLSFNIMKVLSCPDIIIGGILCCASALIYLYALTFEKLSVAYPVTAMIYIWTTILSYYMLGEKITKNKIIAVTLIIAGIILISYF